MDIGAVNMGVDPYSARHRDIHVIFTACLRRGTRPLRPPFFASDKKYLRLRLREREFKNFVCGGRVCPYLTLPD